MTPDTHDSYPLAEVIWCDALGPFDVEDLADHDFAVTRSRTVGWIISGADTDLVAVATTHDWEPNAEGWRDVTSIPRGMVLEINYLVRSQDA